MSRFRIHFPLPGFQQLIDPFIAVTTVIETALGSRAVKDTEIIRIDSNSETQHACIIITRLNSGCHQVHPVDSSYFHIDTESGELFGCIVCDFLPRFVPGVGDQLEFKRCTVRIFDSAVPVTVDPASFFKKCL